MWYVFAERGKWMIKGLFCPPATEKLENISSLWWKRSWLSVEEPKQRRTWRIIIYSTDKSYHVTVVGLMINVAMNLCFCGNWAAFCNVGCISGCVMESLTMFIWWCLSSGFDFHSLLRVVLGCNFTHWFTMWCGEGLNWRSIVLKT